MFTGNMFICFVLLFQFVGNSRFFRFFPLHDRVHEQVLIHGRTTRKGNIIHVNAYLECWILIQFIIS